MDSGDRPPEIRRPFADTPRRAPVEASWRKPVLVGCGVLALLAVVGLTLLVLNAGEIFRWGLGAVRSDVMAHLPAEVTEEERERLADAFDAAGESVAAGAVEPAALKRFQQRLMAVAQTPPEERTREQLLELTETLEEVAASGQGGVEPAPG